MKSKPTLRTVTAAHGYTRADSPWIIGDGDDQRSRFVRYIAGGGMRVFGRTVWQERARAKHRRFYVVAAVLGAIWLWMLVA